MHAAHDLQFVIYGCFCYCNTDCLEQRPGKYMLTANDKKDITNKLFTSQLYSFVMGKQHVLYQLVIQAVNIFVNFGFPFDMRKHFQCSIVNLYASLNSFWIKNLLLL